MTDARLRGWQGTRRAAWHRRTIAAEHRNHVNSQGGGMPGGDETRETYRFADDDDSDDLGGFGRGKRSYEEDEDDEDGGWAINEDHSDRLWDSAEDIDDDDEEETTAADADDAEEEEEEEDLFGGGAPRGRRGRPKGSTAANREKQLMAATSPAQARAGDRHRRNSDLRRRRLGHGRRRGCRATCEKLEQGCVRKPAQRRSAAKEGSRCEEDISKESFRLRRARRKKVIATESQLRRNPAAKKAPAKKAPRRKSPAKKASSFEESGAAERVVRRRRAAPRKSSGKSAACGRSSEKDARRGRRASM